MPYTTREVAEHFGVSQGRVAQWIAAGYLTATKFGQAWMIPEASVEAFKPWERGKHRTPRVRA